MPITKKSICIDCGKEVKFISKRCKPCAGRKHSIRMKGNKCHAWKGGLPYCLDCGKKLSDRRAKRCMLCAAKRRTEIYPNPMKGRSMNLCPGWKGGKTFEEYGADFDDALKEQIRFRDGYKCQLCGCSQLENGKQLDCHHIDYNKKNLLLKNLVSLCRSCHARTNHNRKYWIKYFTMEEHKCLQ